MRRLVLLSSLATIGLGIAAASAQYTYPPGGYRGIERDGVMSADPDDDDDRAAYPAYPRRAAPRSPYDPQVESQPLPSLTERDSGAGYPYENRTRQQAAPAETLPPPPDRNYGYSRPPAYGAAPSYGAPPAYNEPPYASRSPYPDTPTGSVYSGNGYPNGAAPGAYGTPPSGAYSGSNNAPYAARPDELRQGPPRPPGAIDNYRPSYGAGAPAAVAPGGAPGRTTLAALPPEDQPEVGEPKELAPQFKRQVVPYQTKEPAGTVIIDTPSTFLYYVNGDGTAVRYGIGVGREGFTWAGTEKISRMAEWPDWHPPAEMIERQPYLPRFMAGGESNPLGARALYLGKTIYRIHGTNQPSTIGKFVSSGCIRMVNEDVQDLYSRVKVGTKVVVLGDGKGAPAPNTSAMR